MANTRGKRGSNEYLLFLGSKSQWKMTAVMKLKDACSLEGRLPRHIFKKIDIDLLKTKQANKKTPIIKAMFLFLFFFFPVVMYGYESKTIKKAEYWATDAFKLWCRRPFRVPWIARRTNTPSLKEISLEYSLEGLLLNLKLQCFGHLMQRADSLEKTWCWEILKARGEGGSRGWEG